MSTLTTLALALLVEVGPLPWALLADPASRSLPDDDGGSTSTTADVIPAVSGEIIVTTTNDLPGYEVEEVHGAVFGLILRERNAFSNIGGGLRTLVGGETRGYTKQLSDSRTHAVDRLKHAARERGANAVIAMRFDCDDVGDMSEVAAYGTAVRVRRVYAPPAG